MLDFVSDMARRFFKKHPELRRRKSGWKDSSWHGPAELLEARSLLSVTLATPIVNDLPNDKTEFIAANVTNTTNNPVTFTAQSSNSNVTTTVLSGGRSIDFNVSGVDSTNTAFTGDIVVRLFENLAPNTTAHIIQLAQSGFYNGLTFHRVISGFVAQGGDPTGTGSGGSGPGHTVSPINDEFSPQLTYTSNGLIGMANAGHDTNDSQFFITAINESLAQLPQHINFENPIFGIVTSGFSTLSKLMSTPTNSATNKPTTNEVINTATVFTDTNNGVIQVQSKAGFTGSTTLTITADDGHGNTSQKQAAINIVADNVNDPPILGTVTNQVVTQGVPLKFTVSATDLQNDQLTFVVKDPTSFASLGGSANNPSNVTVSISSTQTVNHVATATITVTPSVTFSGTVNMIIGVRDQTTHGGASTLQSPSNFDTQNITLTVNPINHAPTTPGGSISTAKNTPVVIHLTGNTSDPDKNQTLTYINIPSSTAHGTITNIDVNAGTLTYTPNNNFNGLDSFTYQVQDNGGTANQGQDTSSLATFSISVGPPSVTALALTAASDDGVSHTDNVILNSTPTFTVNAPTGSTVSFLVNGTKTVAAHETTPGVFTGTLTRQMLQVGANSITATGTLNNATSDPTAPLNFIYAPSDARIYTVPGAFGSSQQLTFHYDLISTAYHNELGLFAVNDLQGDVNNTAPGSAGYVAAALSSSTRQILFAQGAAQGSTKTINVTGGQLLAFYIVSNNSTADVIHDNTANDPTGVNAFFSVPSANADNFNHMRSTADTQTGRMQLSWEDGLNGGDRDFNDAVISITPGSTTSPTVASSFRVSGGSSSSVPVTFTLLPTQKTYGPAPLKSPGEIGVVTVADNSGTINNIAPGSAGYTAALLNSSTRQVLFNTGDPLNTTKTIQFVGGSLLEFYYIPNGSAANVLSNNSTDDPTKSPIIFFSFDSANPDSANHFRWFDPEQVSESDASAPTNQLQSLLHGTGILNPTQNSFDDFQVAISMAQ